MDHGNGNMDPKIKEEIRHAMNIQFRYKLYRDTVFPFLPSLGVNHIIQSFESKEDDEFIGVLHLWYTNDTSEPSYQTKDQHFVSGYWKHEWLDDPEEAVYLAMRIQQDRPYNENKLIHIAMEHARKAAQKHAKKIIEEESEEVDYLN